MMIFRMMIYLFLILLYNHLYASPKPEPQYDEYTLSCFFTLLKGITFIYNFLCQQVKTITNINTINRFKQLYFRIPNITKKLYRNFEFLIKKCDANNFSYQDHIFDYFYVVLNTLFSKMNIFILNFSCHLTSDIITSFDVFKFNFSKLKPKKTHFLKLNPLFLSIKVYKCQVNSNREPPQQITQKGISNKKLNLLFSLDKPQDLNSKKHKSNSSNVTNITNNPEVNMEVESTSSTILNNALEITSMTLSNENSFKQTDSLLFDKSNQLSSNNISINLISNDRNFILYETFLIQLGNNPSDLRENTQTHKEKNPINKNDLLSPGSKSLIYLMTYKLQVLNYQDSSYSSQTFFVNNNYKGNNDNSPVNENDSFNKGESELPIILDKFPALNHLSTHALPDKTWDELLNNIDFGRKYIANIWMELGLKRSARFINNKEDCSIHTVKKLYDRLNYFLKDNGIFKEENIDNPKLNNNEVKYEEDKILFEETALQLSKETYYVMFEGASYKQIDEFGSILFSLINYELISEEFQIKALGADRFIVGFNSTPPLDLLSRKLPEYKIFLVPFSKLNDLVTVSKELNSGIIFFLNNKIVSYIELQSAVAKLRLEIKSEIKRIHLRKDMFILFVPTLKLTTLVSQLRYLNVNNIIFRSTCNLTPEYTNNTGKLILENSPLNSPLWVKTFLVKILQIDEQFIGKIYQIRSTNNSRLGKNSSAFLVWIKGETAIKMALLSVIDYLSDRRKVGYFKWPKPKENHHAALVCDLVP